MSTTPTSSEAGTPRPWVHLVLITLGVALMLAGIVCIVLSFSELLGSAGLQVESGDSDEGTQLALLGGGGLAMVAGLGIIAFTRVSMMRRPGGGYARVVVEQGHGVRPRRAVGDGNGYCRKCGTALDGDSSFCGSCGAPTA